MQVRDSAAGCRVAMATSAATTPIVRRSLTSLLAMPLTRDQATDAAALDASLDAALAACHPTFAYHPWQRRALKSIMSVPSRDTFVVAPTSAGKSLVMEMAARLLKKPVLIVLPLNALQSDMAASFRSSGLRVLCGATDDVTKVRFALAERFANCDVVMVSAETVTSPSWKKAIAAAGSNLGVIFVDEAHCMNHWYALSASVIAILLLIHSR